MRYILSVLQIGGQYERDSEANGTFAGRRSGHLLGDYWFVFQTVGGFGIFAHTDHLWSFCSDGGCYGVGDAVPITAAICNFMAR